jgi:hypothetical protein
VITKSGFVVEKGVAVRKTCSVGRLAMGIGSVAALGAALLLATPAFAGVSGGVVVSYPGTSAVGDSFSASLTITNTSSGANAAEPVLVTSIRHTPSCGAGIATCDTPDAGVYAVSNPVAEPSSACAWVKFSVGSTDATTGEVEFVPSGDVVLGNSIMGGGTVAKSQCRINFTVTVVKVPTVDADAAAGLQTKHMARVQFKGQQSGNAGAASGSNASTVQAAN